MTPEQKQLIRDFIAAQKTLDKSAAGNRKQIRDLLMAKVEQMVK